MLTKASFANFKALKHVDVGLTPFTVIVGKNGSGKTSVLQGIHAVALLASQTAIAFPSNRDPRRLATRPRTGPMSIALTDARGSELSWQTRFETDEDGAESYEFTIGLTGKQSPALSISGDEFNGPDSTRRRELQRRAERAFGSAVFLRLDARVMARESFASSEEPRLEHDGEKLASVLNYMAGAAPDVLDAIQRDLTAVVPQVRGIRTFPARIKRRQHERVVIGDQAVHRSFDEEVPGHRFALDMGSGRLIEADLLSEGTVLALGLLTALRHPQCPRLVLLDDIDGALHSTAQTELVRAIRHILSARPDVQVVCSSHSPDFLDSVSLEEIRVMALDADGYARCSRLSDHPESERWRKMLRTGEFWASVGEDWLLEGPDSLVPRHRSSDRFATTSWR